MEELNESNRGIPTTTELLSGTTQTDIMEERNAVKVMTSKEATEKIKKEAAMKVTSRLYEGTKQNYKDSWSERRYRMKKQKEDSSSE